MTTNYFGTVCASVGLATPTISNGGCDMHVNLNEGAAFRADRISTSTPGADLHLDSSGENIDCCGKRLINVGAVVGTDKTGDAARGTSAGAAPFQLMSLETATDTAYVVTSSVAAMGAGAGAAYFHVFSVCNCGGALTVTQMVASEHVPPALAGLSFEFVTDGTALRAVACGLAATAIKWAGSLTYSATV